MSRRTALPSALALLLGLSLATAGCGSGDDAAADLPDPTFTVVADKPSWQSDDSKADLDWYINFDWFAQSWGKDMATKFITEDTGANVTYLAGDDDKLNTMLASNDLPCMITVDGGNPVVKDAAKFAIPLDELAAKYDPYFMTNAAKSETLKFFTQEDGHIYGYPNFSTTTEDYDKGGLYGNQAFLVRKDVYEKLGKPSLATPEEFMSALKAADKLGMKDEMGKKLIPFGTMNFDDGGDPNAIFNRTLADFIGVPVLTSENTYNDRQADEEYQTWIKTISQAHRDGLTDPDMLIMSEDEKNARLVNGSYFAYFAPNLIGETSPLSSLYKDHPDMQYIAIDGPQSTEGRKTSLLGPSIEGWTQTFITKSCKDPQKAMILMSYLVSEYGDTVMNFGREGETYTMVDGVPRLNKDLLELKLSDPAKFEKEIGLTTHLWLSDSALLSRQMGLDQFATALQQPKEWTSKYIAPQFQLAALDTMLSTSEVRNREKINQEWSKTIAKAMKAGSDADVQKLLTDYYAYRDSHGWEDIVNSRNEQIRSNISRLE